MGDLIPQKHGGKLRRIPKGTSGNPKGRPRKAVPAVLSALEAAGHAEVTAAQVRSAMSRALGLSRRELVAIGNDEDARIMDALIARALAGKDAWNAFDGIIDRIIGKAKQALALEHGEQKHTITFRRKTDKE